jgi:hypothetical protein
MSRRHQKGAVKAGRPRVRSCPKCGLKRRLGEIDLVPGYALGHFGEDGLWMFDGATEMWWDGQRPEHDPPRFVCLNCDTVFDLSGKIY